MACCDSSSQWFLSRLAKNGSSDLPSASRKPSTKCCWGEQLEVQRGEQHGHRRLAEDHLGHGLGVVDDVAGRAEVALEGPAEAGEELLVLDLLVGEAEQRAELGRLPEHLGVGMLEHAGDDVLLHEIEEIEVAVAHDLVELEALPAVEEREPRRRRHGVGEEAAAEIQLHPLGKDVVELPRDLLGRAYTALVIVVRRDHGTCLLAVFTFEPGRALSRRRVGGSRR